MSYVRRQKAIFFAKLGKKMLLKVNERSRNNLNRFRNREKYFYNPNS